ncbi:MAG: GAF domain-containing protein [Deltaproteobacteria bacterium]|nr:GAF domain-containing protein [Deltaproteobacteria bacterium]
MSQPDGATMEHRARDVLDNLLEGCQVIGPDYTYRYVNEAVAKHGRTTRERLLGRTMMEAYPGIENTEMFDLLRRCLQDRSARHMENEFTFPDGSKSWFELRFEPVPEGVAILSIDITERRRAQETQRRLTRALTVLSDCNQTLVRAEDEQQFMRDVCRIAVERGGYRLAWIGMKDSDAGHSVQPVARAGHDEGYVDRVGATWDDSERGQGPTGRAIRSGRPVVARIIHSDADFAPWRKDAIERGFASSIALPIMGGDECVGALMMYTAEPDAFDDQERKLLEEMALDLGYGLTTLRTRSARLRAEARVTHLNAVLCGIRNVNQLITREQDPQALITKTCELLVESRGFHTAWLVLRDGDRTVASADAGVESKLRAIRRMVSAGELPMCVSRALEQADVVVRQNPAATCESCPVTTTYSGERDVATVRLESEGRTFGALLVSLPPSMAADPEELDLLREVAGDVAFALRAIEVRSEQQKAEQAARESEHRYRALFENANMGIAHCRMVYEGDRPVDFVYLEVNAALERLTGLKNTAGRRVSEVVPGIHESDPAMLQRYDRVVRTGRPERFEVYRKALGQWLDISVYSPTPEHFVAVFDNITSRKQTEGNLVKFTERLERMTGVVQSLSQAQTSEAVAEIVRHAARELVGSDGATFVLRDGDLCHYVDEDAIAPLWKGKRFPLTACISGWAMRNQKPAVVEDIYADDRIPHDAYRSTFVKSLVMVPIRRQSPIGAIGSYWADQRLASPEDVRILQALADSTSVAMENVRVLRELEEGKARTRAIYDHLPNAAFVWRRSDDGFVLVDFNEAANAMSNGQLAGLIGKSPAEICGGFPHAEEDLARCFEQRTVIRREVDRNNPGAREPRLLVLTYGFIPSDMVILHAEDVTEQRQTEEQLKLAQRLEAVGRLAGGVAHDFNNLLSVIISYAGFAASELRESDPIRADIVEIESAGKRAASLTRQLLAFSRKQLLEPEVLSLNKVVGGIESMLRRLLGEDIDIEVHLAEDLGSIMADPGQIEQVIMNLAVNARDAMPRGGKLTVETANVVLDEEYANQHIAVKPGRYVMLSVTDTGTGMDPAVKEHLFEPFFTTKEKGKGTGLGLSTVYGIVKQSGGNVWVYSEVGQGTTFKVYLPRVDAPAVETTRRSMPAIARGSETVLVVEDEDAVRRLAERILRSAGYKVLAAASGGDALLLWEKHRGEIDLLLTDVVMPQMSGRELAERLGKPCPTLKVLYMSGYTDNAIVHHGVLDPGTRFIGKPFSTTELTRKVREALDER